MIRKEWWRWEYILRAEHVAVEMNAGTLLDWATVQVEMDLQKQGGVGLPSIEKVRVRPYKDGQTGHLRLVLQGQSERRV